MTTKEIKQLNKAYSNKFAMLQKSLFTDIHSGLVLFAEYLKYVRDFTILAEFYCESDNTELKLASIMAALAEFDAYAQVEDDKQKIFHWNNFCELIKQNMEAWLKIDDSV